MASNDAHYSVSGSNTWAANYENCIGTWIELTPPTTYTISQAAFRQRYSPEDQRSIMTIALKSSSGVVLHSESVAFANVNVQNAPEETFVLPATSGVKSVRFTYTAVGSSSNCAPRGYLGAKRVRLHGFVGTEALIRHLPQLHITFEHPLSYI